MYPSWASESLNAENPLVLKSVFTIMRDYTCLVGNFINGCSANVSHIELLIVLQVRMRVGVTPVPEPKGMRFSTGKMRLLV